MYITTLITLTMHTTALLFLAAISSVVGHEHTGNLQEHLSAQGPHRERLWYNTLPGDGGTQVYLPLPLILWFILICLIGRLGILWHLHIWTPAILSMPSFRRREIRYCLPRYGLLLHAKRFTSNMEIQVRRLIPARPIALEPVLAHPEFAKAPGVSTSTADTMFHSLPTHSIPGPGSLTAVTYRLLRLFSIQSPLSYPMKTNSR
jgi:hypothetical protein